MLPKTDLELPPPVPSTQHLNCVSFSDAAAPMCLDGNFLKGGILGLLLCRHAVF